MNFRVWNLIRKSAANHVIESPAEWDRDREACLVAAPERRGRRARRHRALAEERWEQQRREPRLRSDRELRLLGRAGLVSSSLSTQSSA